MRDAFAFCWTIFVVVVGLVIGFAYTSDFEYNGSTVPFHITYRDFKVSGEKNVKISVGSKEFFTYRNQDGSVIYGVQKTPPLGWEHQEYFEGVLENASPGIWEKQKGSGGFIIESYDGEALSVTTYNPLPWLTWLIVIVVACLVWLIVIGFVTSN